MRKTRPVGVLVLLLGVLILFLLRGPLYELILAVLNLAGILVGLILVVVGIWLVLGGGALGRRRGSAREVKV